MGGGGYRLPYNIMKTITIDSGVVKNKYQKFLKVCNLFDSKMEVQANDNVFDVKTNANLIESIKFDQKLSLRITGEDETHAALLIKECIAG